MMKRLRRTLSFRSRSKYRANNNPANWEDDSIIIKHGGLSFPAKVWELPLLGFIVRLKSYCMPISFRKSNCMFLFRSDSGNLGR